MLLTREKSQLLIVDVQDKLLDAISGKDRVVERCVRLVRAARMLNVPITLSEQYPQGLGPTVDPIREASANAGFVVEDSQVELSLARRIDELLCAPDNARCLGKNGQGFAREHFTWQRVARDMVSLYRKILAE